MKGSLPGIWPTKEGISSLEVFSWEAGNSLIEAW